MGIPNNAVRSGEVADFIAIFFTPEKSTKPLFIYSNEHVRRELAKVDAEGELILQHYGISPVPISK